MSSKSNPIDVHVGSRLRVLRLRKGITQEELGALVGVSYQQIQKYETGSNRVSASRLYILSLHLDVGPEYFFGDMDPASIAAARRQVESREQGDEAGARV